MDATLAEPTVAALASMAIVVHGSLIFVASERKRCRGLLKGGGRG